MIDSVRRIHRICKFLLELMCAKIVSSILKFFSQKYRDIWIIAERGDDARDNGFFFYKYLCEKQTDVNIYYIISSRSADFERVSRTGKWVEYGSFKHYIFYCLSVVRVSSSMWGGDLPCADYFFKLRRYMSKKRKFIFLKHGIIKDYLPQHCVQNGSPDLYICGAKPEYEYVRKTFGHPENNVVYTGLARFDNLRNTNVKKQILVMPTFRRWLQGKTDAEVMESEYVQKYNELLHNPELHQILDKTDTVLVFYPHYVMQKYIDFFTSDCERIIIAKFKDYDVQTLLIESNLLITDFSSVFFDFGYMEKPVIYYQFDREKYIAEHYDFTKGYFSYDENGFGPVARCIDDLMDDIVTCVDNGMKMENTYLNRIDAFFPLRDQKNCERIYKEITKILF